MTIFTQEFKDWCVTTAAKTFAYTVVFGPVLLLIDIALRME